MLKSQWEAATECSVGVLSRGLRDLQGAVWGHLGIVLERTGDHSQVR